MSVELDLTGSVALVTGAGRGIGREIALALAAAGADVAVNDFADEAACAAVVGEIEKLGRKGLVVMGDVSDEQQVNAMVDRAEADLGPLGVVVNNAGITRDGLLLRMKIEDWDAILNTNLSSVFRLSKAVLRGMMKARSGRIISIASVVGLTGNAGQANYAAAKAGIIGFSKSLAREVASRNITSNVVAPGFIDTDMTRALSEEQRTALAGSIPLARLGSPEDIAAAVLYLASPAGAYVTGETLSVNGGMYMP